MINMITTPGMENHLEDKPVCVCEMCSQRELTERRQCHFADWAKVYRRK